MHNLGLLSPAATRPVDVVARLGAMQAQEFPYAKWSIGQRVSGVDDREIDRLFDRGALLRTHLLRPTWHFVTPKDIRWILRLTAPRVKRMMATYDRQLDLDERLYSRTNRLIEKALRGGEHLTRKELVAVLNRSKVTGDGRRFGHILLRAELEGIICSGARRGREQTYALFDERVRKSRDLDAEEALAELTRRYFTTRAPATLKDFSWWSSLKMEDCRRGVEFLGGELDQLEIDGRVYLIPTESGPPSPTKEVVDLVQVYDECVVSYTLSRDALTATVEADIPRDIMFFWHPILLDGQVIGHWRRRNKGELTWLEVFTYRKLTRAEARARDLAVRRYEEFLGRSLDVKEANINPAAAPRRRPST
jgi:Winged helix DNA-binding domain